MGRPTNAEIAARAAAAAANEQKIEGETPELEDFQKPVEVVTPDEVTPAGLVKIRVLPRGDGRISTGKYDANTFSFSYHKKGDHLFVPPNVARVQEEAGLVEIVA